LLAAGAGPKGGAATGAAKGACGRVTEGGGVLRWVEWSRDLRLHVTLTIIRPRTTRRPSPRPFRLVPQELWKLRKPPTPLRLEQLLPADAAADEEAAAAAAAAGPTGGVAAALGLGDQRVRAVRGTGQGHAKQILGSDQNSSHAGPAGKGPLMAWVLLHADAGLGAPMPCRCGATRTRRVFFSRPLSPS
jgi:hypothetical protein